MTDKKIEFVVNGITQVANESFKDWALLRYLREVLNLTGTKQGCDNEGTCGLCKVIIDGKARFACRTKVGSLDGAHVETIENLVVNGQPPHPLIQTVIQDGIFQCGFCAPGAIMTAKALLDQTLEPTDAEIERALSSILCRCAGLNRMDQSIKRAAAILRGDEESTWTSEDTANEAVMLEKVTGKLVFTDDLKFPGMLYASALRANVPHARVKGLDVRDAQKMPGIVKVLTSKDIPGKNLFGPILMDQPIFCDEQNDVRYVGDALALVVGESPEQVQAALEKVKVELEPLPVIGTIEEALAPDAPVLHKRLAEQHPDMPNVLIHFHTSKGDIEQGFQEAEIILEDDYSVPFIEHAYMEPESSISMPEEHGVVVYAGSQGPTDDRRQIASALGLPEEKVRIAHMYMGGGFGGKEDISTQIHSALAAMLTGKPVKVKWSREESLKVSYKRHAAKLHYKFGAKKDGRIVAADINIYGDTGAYASAGEAVLFRMSAFACGPYEVPHVNVHTYAVHTNNPPCGAFRGYGSPQVAFAAEIHLQKIIDQLGLDALQVRLQNALDIGKATITGDVLTEEVGVGIIQCLQAVQKAVKQLPKPELQPGEKLGIGISAAYKNVGLGSNIPDNAGARVSLEKDGKFLIRHGAADMGQGSNQVVAVIASRVLGVPVPMFRVHTGDTRYDPEGGMTTASRATFVSGNAALKASEGLRDLLWKAVAGEYNVPVEELEICNDVFRNTRTGQTYISLKELAQGSEEFAFEAHYQAPRTQPPSAHSEAYPVKSEAPLHFAYDFGAQAVQLAVNVNNGHVRVIKLISAQDVGLPLIRRNVIGQMEGAAVQGLGYALTEQFEVENGNPKSLHLKDMGLLRFRNIPEIQTIMVEEAHPKGPFGAKGMGELALSPTAPAVANAIHDAVGVWINSLPITPEKILAALKQSE